MVMQSVNRVFPLTFEMPTAKIDIVVQQGATFYLPLAFVETWNPYTLLDLTGYIARSRIRPSYDDALVVDMTTANGRITLGTQGTIPYQYNCILTIDQATTDAFIEWGEGVWDLELTNPFGVTYRWAEGAARLSRAATR